MRLWPIYVTYFFLTSALGVVFVFLEDVQRERGLADWEIGVITGTGFATALVAQLALSPLADRGHRLPLALAALTAGILGPVGFAYGTTMVVLAAGRGLSGIGLGLFALLARKALLGLSVTGGGAKLGMLLSTAVAGFIVGPLIGAALEPLGFAAPFLAVSAAVLVAGVPAVGTILRSEMASAPVDYSDLGRLLRRPRIQAALLVEVIVFGLIGVFDSIVDRFLTDLGASTTEVAVVILFVGGPMLVLPRVAGSLAERRGAATLMLAGLLVIVPAQIGYGLAGTVVAATAFGLLHGCGESFASISAQVLVLEVTGTERAAVGTALLTAAGYISATISAAVTPSAYGAGGQHLFLGAAAVGVALGLVALQRVGRARDEELVPAA